MPVSNLRDRVETGNVNTHNINIDAIYIQIHITLNLVSYISLWDLMCLTEELLI